MDSILKAALDWINEIANPDTLFIHPNDENKVKCASRALDKMGIRVDKNELIGYCGQLGMPREATGKIVDWFTMPRALRLKNGMTFTLSELKSVWKEMVDDQ